MAKSAPDQQNGARTTLLHSDCRVMMALARESDGNERFPSNLTSATSTRPTWAETGCAVAHASASTAASLPAEIPLTAALPLLPGDGAAPGRRKPV